MPLGHPLPSRPGRSPRRRWAALVVISVAVSLIIVDSTIVNVAVPSIVEDLGSTSTQVQWVQEAYTLVFAALLLLFGTLGDRIGRKRLLLLGVALFGASSVVAASAPTTELLIAARLVQGVGGAMILPASLSLINATFEGRERGIAFAVWGSAIGGMAAVGPLLGGWLTEDFSWRWAFGLNVPLGALILLGAALTVRESRSGDPRPLDGVGALLSVVLFGALTFGLIEGRSMGWWTAAEELRLGTLDWELPLSPVPIAFAAAALSLVGFVLWARHRMRIRRAALLELSLLRIPSFRNGSIVALVVSLGEFGIILSLPIWLQFVLGFDALQTGLLLVALAGGSFLASGMAAGANGRIAPVQVVRAGLLAEIIGILWIGLVVAPDAAWGWLVPALAVYGIGVGSATAQLTGVILQDVPVELSGQGSGAQSTARQVGSALGIAILGTVLFSSTAGLLSSALEDRGLPDAQNAAVVSAVVDSAGAAIAGLEQDPGTAEAARSAFSDGTRYAAFTAAGFLVLGLAATRSLGSPGRGRARDGDVPRDPAARADEVTAPQP